MKPVVLDSIPCSLDAEGLADRLRVRSGGRHFEKLVGLIEEAQRLAKPKALYRPVGYQIDGDRVAIDDVVLTSRLLVKNLQSECQAYPFLATCGTELDDWAGTRTGSLERFWVESIKESALEIAVTGCIQHIDENHHPGSLSMMNPGSLQDWPLTEQAKVLAILEEPISVVGVRLTESSMMIPLKTVSGILFPSREGFVNCQYCPREDCSSRRAQRLPDHRS